MDSEVLIEYVRTEVKNLKKHATKEELDRLDFKTLVPALFQNCIYGQMTGNCNSARAVELMHLCTKVFIEWNRFHTMKEGSFDHRIVFGITRGKHTPLELYLLRSVETSNERIIKFLKGELKRLYLP